MKLSYVLLNEENRGDFEDVFPRNIDLVPLRVAVGAVDEQGRVLGAISYILANYEYSLDWLFIEPSVRLMGVGTRLLEEVFRAIVRTEDLFPLSAKFEFSDENYELHTFFLSMKHMYTTYSHERYYVTRDDIRNSPGLRRSAGADIVTELFFDKPESEQKKILSMLMREETYEVTDYENWKKSCVPELCRCAYVKNNLVNLIFMQWNPDRSLELSYLYGKYPKGLFGLLFETVKDLESLFPGVKVAFDAVTEESETMAKHLFPRAKKAHIYEAEF